MALHGFRFLKFTAFAVFAAVSLAAGDESQLPMLLKAYDQSMKEKGGADTVAIEEELVQLLNNKNAAALTPHLGHPRFGPLVFWALSECEANGSAQEAVKALAGYERKIQMDCLPFIARYRSDAFAPWLRAFGEKMSAEERRRHGHLLRGALIGSSSQEALDEALRLLKSSDDVERLDGARSIGQARNPDLCRSHLGALLDSTKPLRTAQRSLFEDFTDAKEGQRNGAPIELKTEKDLALEAFNFAVWKPYPQWMLAVFLERGSLNKAPLGFNEKSLEAAKAKPKAP